MKTALIADIHSNIVAFEAVVNDIEGVNPDLVVCLGDVVSMGARPRECIALLRSLGCPTVMGNTDDWILDPKPAPDADEERLKIEEMDRWNAEQLTAEERSFISSFRPLHRLDLGEGAQLLAYHGSPKSFDDWITADTALELLDRYFDGESALLRAGGHTHIPMVRRHRGSFVINPGSVGLAYDPYPPDAGTKAAPWAEFAVVVTEGARVSVELKRIPYDVAGWLEILRASGLPHAEWFAENFTI